MKKNKYVIISTIFGSDDILSYCKENRRNDGSNGDGYFFTGLETFLACYKDYPEETVIFSSKKQAKRVARYIGLKQKHYKIRKFNYTLF